VLGSAVWGTGKTVTHGSAALVEFAHLPDVFPAHLVAILLLSEGFHATHPGSSQDATMYGQQRRWHCFSTLLVKRVGTSFQAVYAWVVLHT
jgi:hypothetical protein